MKNSDLNKIFPDINRKSKRTDEAHFYDELRFSPAVTVISGGQTGVDSVGLEVASFLGLPAFAILPENGRREDGSFEKYLKEKKLNVRTYELSSESYRFRTYANAFYSDFTIIYDFVNSEGTKATVDACEYFGRPYKVIQTLGQESFQEILEMLTNFRPQVVNIAGNSLSKIDEDVVNRVKNHLTSVLRTYCFLRKNPNGNVNEEIDEAPSKPTIAIPNFSVSKTLFADFLEKEYGIKIQFTKKLVYDLEPFQLVVARPREIIRLVKNGVTAGFVGEDLCVEYDYHSILLDTGLIPNAMVLCAKEGWKQDLPICSQYPVFAKQKFAEKEIVPITGSAESFLTLDIYGAAVDSYQTGVTLQQNGLEAKRKLGETSLTLIGDESVKCTPFYASLVHYLTTYEAI